MFRRLFVLIAMVAALVVIVPTAADAGPNSCEKRSNNNINKLLECVTVDGVREHQAAFQSFADATDGTREASSPGYQMSGDYVAGLLEDAGYDVTIQAFDFPFFEELVESELEELAPTPFQSTYFTSPSGHATMSYSGSGDATAPTQGVDIVDPADLPPDSDNVSTSGCEIEDFADFVAGNIAIVQRGSCSFAAKAFNAEASGAVGVVIFNEGQPGRDVNFAGTLGGPGLTIPAVGASTDVGLNLLDASSARIAVTATSEIRSTFNVIADGTKGDSDNVVMVGAHLDSVAEGPGIQDNGSGSAAILEVALQMAKVNPRNQVRFAWWGAEEAGLLGSEHYVGELSDAELDQIALYLNFDMIGSPNYFFGIYDGDDSDAVGAGPGPEGSAQIEATFEQYYDTIGQPYQGTDFSGRSDYGPFIAVGIPAGGLFTGAEGIKTVEEVALYGGTAGDQYDPCYHLACDTYDNISLFALEVNADAVAYATLNYAMSTELINGGVSKGNFKPGQNTHDNPANWLSDTD